MKDNIDGYLSDICSGFVCLCFSDCYCEYLVLNIWIHSTIIQRITQAELRLMRYISLPPCDCSKLSRKDTDKSVYPGDGDFRSAHLLASPTPDLAYGFTAGNDYPNHIHETLLSLSLSVIEHPEYLIVNSLPTRESTINQFTAVMIPRYISSIASNHNIVGFLTNINMQTRASRSYPQTPIRVWNRIRLIQVFAVPLGSLFGRRDREGLLRHNPLHHLGFRYIHSSRYCEL